MTTANSNPAPALDKSASVRGGTLPSYSAAVLRCVLPVTGLGMVGIGFDLADGTIVRLKLPREHAWRVAEGLLEMLRSEHYPDPVPPECQSPISLGNPSAAVSPHDAEKT